MSDEWKFSVDSKLLRELGERLVGKPSIALAELIKNSYDADANFVTIDFNPQRGEIVVTDDGCGMSVNDFVNYWMKIGSTHKEKEGTSLGYQRPLTGSKGVGRLAAQFLAHEIVIETVTKNEPQQRLEVKVDWKEAINAGEITQAKAEWKIVKPDPNHKNGTRIRLLDMKAQWNEKEVLKLAQEIWWLQPPFRAGVIDPKMAFTVTMNSSDIRFENAFRSQMHAILDIWQARIVGKNENGIVNMSVEFRGEAKPFVKTYELPSDELAGGEFEIRLYRLDGRQPHGIKVDGARAYMRQWGGIHVYDAGFRLPFYGDQKNDWLGIMQDHSRRVVVSELLPKEWQTTTQGMRYVPTLSRVLGVVRVNTQKEKDLKITITRDRLTESSPAYENLVRMLKWALHYYALEEARRADAKKSRKKSIKAPEEEMDDLTETLSDYRNIIGEEAYQEFESKVKEATDSVKAALEAKEDKLSAIAPVATAGILSIAYQHELRKQFSTMDEVTTSLEKIAKNNPVISVELIKIKDNLDAWLKRAKATNSLFDFMMDSGNISSRSRLNAKRTLNEVKRQAHFFIQTVEVKTDRMDEDFLLPNASFAEWSSIFQNVIINSVNAINATDENGPRTIDVKTECVEHRCRVMIQDTGCGLNVSDSDKYFEPFERGIELSDKDKRQGFGGTGLGLAIVKLIARRIGCRVKFAPPENGFKTSFVIEWEETEDEDEYAEDSDN